MDHLLEPSARARLRFALYRSRFLALYIAFGFLSLWVEIILLRGLGHLGLHSGNATVIGVAAGIIFAFWMNVRFNFKVPVAKRNRALLYFAGISLLSASLNFAFKRELMELGWSYESARFTLSGVLFFFGYLLHRRFSFRDRKQVGVAVYANGVEDIRGIRDKIGDFPDFIHVDLIDASYGSNDTDVRSYRLEAIRAYWPRREIQVHLMTRHPLRWLPDVLPYADLVIVHAEIDDPLDEVLQRIHHAGRKAGLCLQLGSPTELARPLFERLSVLMFLAIAQPGRSGQPFQLAVLEKIAAANTWPGRSRVALCVDGGVNEANIHLLNVELVVSGSSVLRAADPARQVMRLQTSSNYEAL